MRRELDHDSKTLGEQLLNIYWRALCENKPSVAEQLLCILEELARSDPASGVLLERAYLLIGHGSLLKA